MSRRNNLRRLVNNSNMHTVVPPQKMSFSWPASALASQGLPALRHLSGLPDGVKKWSCHLRFSWATFLACISVARSLA